MAGREFTQSEWDAVSARAIRSGAWVMTPDGVGIAYEHVVVVEPVVDDNGQPLGGDSARETEDWIVHLAAEDGTNRHRLQPYEADSFDAAGQAVKVTLQKEVTDERAYTPDELRRATAEEIPASRRPVIVAE